ncbi:MAG: methyltransferase [Desulfovibrio sp.]|jgi:tRNA1Val (adenine37-N6)-methyltransferase|nr:methyltransferase [Desulfovibrio sp.]
MTDHVRRNEAGDMDENIAAARAFFPRGLIQPPGSFRFSSEALYPASFADPGSCLRLLDLGTGCGVTALAALCLNPSIKAAGVEILPEQAEAAALNAARLGFSHAFRIVRADLADRRLFAPAPECTATGGTNKEHPYCLTAHSFDVVTANPPYRQRGKGRLPADAARRTALFEENDTPDIFCKAAAAALKETGRLSIIYPAARLPDLTAALKRAALTPLRMLPLCPRAGDAAKRLLLEAAPAHAALPPLRVEAPLVLHEADGRFSRAALDFCPFLLCNI